MIKSMGQAMESLEIYQISISQTENDPLMKALHSSAI